MDKKNKTFTCGYFPVSGSMYEAVAQYINDFEAQKYSGDTLSGIAYNILSILVDGYFDKKDKE